MKDFNQDNLRIVGEYHDRTKHRLDRYAASLGYLDWANQPDPFRTFLGAPQINLPHPDLRDLPTYDGLFSSSNISRGARNAELVGRLFYHSLALSAWKKVAHSDPWSLRINPSSGALHPTEGYLISGPVEGLLDAPGVFHYAPFRHRLEQRAELSPEQWRTLSEGLPSSCLLLALTSIYWRESWKYGERAFRYCHHDVGHAVGALAFSARTLGWQTRVLDSIPNTALSQILGISQQSGPEAEHADCLVVVYPENTDDTKSSVSGIPSQDWQKRIPKLAFTGKPNPLSLRHHEWPAIDEVSSATQGQPVGDAATLNLEITFEHPDLPSDRNWPAEQIIRQRRSAVAMDGETWLSRTVFYRMLRRTLPAWFACRTLPWAPQVSLALFVHRVTGLDPGLYLLVRDPSHEPSLRTSLKPDFEWRQPPECPSDLPLFLLSSGDSRQTAKTISCDQDIAADGVFSLGMLARFDAALGAHGSAFYPRLFWETGIIGQVLYLEAEAARVRGTGIGCFFDDAMHDLLGIKDHSWQSLYHFTVGGPTEDPRLQTIPPYAHLTASPAC